MKKGVLALAVLVLTVNSCRSDSNDNGVSNSPTNFVGTWKMVKNVKVSGRDNSVISSTTSFGCFASNTFQFATDYKFNFKLFDSLNGAPCALVETRIGTYSYNVNSKILSFVYSDNTTENVQIESLTDSEFVTIEDLNADYNGDGINDKEMVYFHKQ